MVLHMPSDTFDVEKLNGLAAEHGMIPKDEFHVTVIGNTNGQRILDALAALPRADRAAKREAIVGLIAAHKENWKVELLPLGYELHSIKDAEQTIRRSVVEMVKVPGLEQFIANLNELLGLTLETQPPHITLCTAGSVPEKSKMGIGVDTEDDLESYKKEKLYLGSDFIN